MPKKFAVLALLLLLLSACQNNSNLAITIQTEQTITNDKLTLNVSTSDGKNHQVELLKNGEVFERLETPFSYVWNTTKETEGEYAFQARVDRVTSNKLMLTVDRSAPAITKSLPLKTNTNVKLSNPITIQFSEAVDPATLESAIHLMSGDDALEKDFSLSADGRTLTITPTTNPLSFPATLELSLKGLKDLAGNSLVDTSWNWELPYWVNLKGSLNVDTTKSARATIAFDRQNYPIALIIESNTEDISASQLHVKRWNGSSWESLGAQINAPSRYFTHGQMIIDNNDNPIIAYYEYMTVDDLVNGNSPLVYIKQWNGTEWEIVSSSDGHYPTQLRKDGKHLAQSQDATHIYVQQWTGNQWETIQTIPTGFTLQDDVFTSFTTLDNNNHPVTAWVEHDPTTGFDYKLQVKRWTGNEWETLGTQAINHDDTRILLQPIIGVDPDNNPVILWDEISQLDGEPSNRMFYIKRWTGSAWETFEEGSINVDQTANASLILLDFDTLKNPILSWREGSSPMRSYAKGWVNGQWQLIGGGSLNINPARDAYGAIFSDNQGNHVAVVSELVDGAYQVFLREANH